MAKSMTTLIVKLLTGALLFNMCVTTVAHAAGVEEVPVTSMGFGGLSKLS
jgi:hypothetical protein